MIKDIIKKVKQIEIRSKRKTNTSLIGLHSSAFKGQGMTFSEVRPYQFGDEIRRIDWNKTARFQEPFVKVMEEERELTIIFLVDISASMDYGTHISLKKEFVAEICASIGLSAVGNNDKVGLILFADKVYKVIPPKKSKKHLLAVISSILSASYIPAETSIDNALDYVMNAFKKRALLFILSDFEAKYSSKLLKIAAKKNSLLGIRISDEKDNQIPDIGIALLTDSETGEQIWANTSSPRWQYNFREAKMKKLHQLKTDFESASAALINLNTGDDYVKSLRTYFKR